MKVREFLTPLLKINMERLCRKRELSISGTVPELLERLARSYKGEFTTVIEDLRREDLLVLGTSLKGHLDLPTRWRQLDVGQLRQVFKVAVTEATTVHAEEQKRPQRRSNTPTSVQLSNNLGGGANFQLYSSDGIGTADDVQVLNIKTLHKEALRAKRTTVISAYYSEEILKKLLGACEGEIRVILNGLGGRRLKTQVEELEALQDGLPPRLGN